MRNPRSSSSDRPGPRTWTISCNAKPALQPEHDGATVVSAYSTFEPNNVLVRAMIPIIRRKFHQTQRAILAGLKESLEAPRDSIGTGVDLGKSHS